MKRQLNTNSFNTFKFGINIRLIWYSVLIWVMGFLVAAVVIIPWYYLALTLVIVLTTVFYFKIVKPFEVKRGRRSEKERDKVLAFGLGAAIAWFAIVGVLTILEIGGFYYFDFLFYFSDFRNWYLLTLVLLVPFVYSLLVEHAKYRRR